MKIEVIDNQKGVKTNKANIKNIASKFLKYLKQPPGSALNIIFVSPDKIRKINRELFKESRITDVIAIDPGKFNKDIYSNYLGDVVICPQKAKANAKRFNTSVKDEITLYVAHGILHLLNYSDLNTASRKKMEKRQKELMSIA